jgi:hypothetical protein
LKKDNNSKLRKGYREMKRMKAKTENGMMRNMKIRRVLLSLVFLIFAGLFFLNGFAEAQITQVNFAQATASGANLDIPLPSGTADNDIMIMAISSKGIASALTLPGGWTTITESDSVDVKAVVAWKRASGESGPYTVTGASDTIVGAITSYRGAAGAGNPIGDYSANPTIVEGTVTGLSITPALANSMIIFTAHISNDTTLSWDGGSNPTWTSDYNVLSTGGSDATVSAAYGIKTDTTATGSRTGTHATGGGGSKNNVGIMIALTPGANETFPGSVTAVALDTTTIRVTIPYTGDDNASNTYDIEYKLATEPTTWTALGGNPQAHQASPAVIDITSLTEAEIYDVRVQINDADNAPAPDPQIIYGIVTGPSTKTSANMATIRVLLDNSTTPETGQLLVRMPFNNDTNSNNTYTLEYKLSSEPTIWTTVPGSPFANEPSGIFKTTVTDFTLNERYDIRLTFNDADGVEGFGTTGAQTYSDVLMNPTIHNSYNYSMRKWGGKWGVVGGQYGEFVCTTCHERFPSANIKRIKDSGPIVAPDNSNGDFPGASTTVSFLSAVDGSSDFGDDSTAPRATSNKICEVCHSIPEYHKFDQTLSPDHFDNDDCMKCHNHATGFYPAGGECVVCHSQPQNQLYNVRQIVGAGGDFVRPSHHVSDGTTTQIVTNYDCAICHREGDAEVIAAGEGWLDLYMHKNGESQSTRMVKLRNVDDRNAGWEWNKWVPNSAMRDDMDSFCMGCHDADGASDIAVNNTNDGLIFGSANTTTTTRSVTGVNNANNDGVTVNLRPFNTNDTLVGNTTDFADTFLSGFKTGDAAGTYGRVLNVKDQFNSTDQVGRSWASHHNLNQFTKRYATRNTTFFPDTLFNGITLNDGGDLKTLGETAGLHCGDCHLNEANAHGAANSRYMLQDKNGGDTAWNGASNSNGGTHICYKCHSSAVYDNAGTAGRFQHSRDESRTLTTMTSPLGIICFNCHGGYSTNTDGAQPRGALGAIHGTNEDYVPGGATGTSKRYRFMSGSAMRFYRPASNGATDIADADWESGTDIEGTCYTVGATDNWTGGGCSQHSGGVQSGTVNYQKDLDW